MTLRIAALWLCALALPAWSQGVRAGVKAGVPMTQYFETGASGSRISSAVYSAATRRYTLGVAGEWWWSEAVGLELDVMYHRMGYTATVHSFGATTGAYRDTAIDVKGHSWDFPMMLKYRFRGRVRPYAAGGGALRYIGPVRGRGQETSGSLVERTSVTTPLDVSEPSELRKRFYPGLTVAGGLELGAGRIRLLPEIRYTRWTANIAGPGGVLRFAPNQVEFLLGVWF